MELILRAQVKGGTAKNLGEPITWSDPGRTHYVHYKFNHVIKQRRNNKLSRGC